MINLMTSRELGRGMNFFYYQTVIFVGKGAISRRTDEEDIIRDVMDESDVRKILEKGFSGTVEKIPRKMN